MPPRLHRFTCVAIAVLAIAVLAQTASAVVSPVRIGELSQDGTPTGRFGTAIAVSGSTTVVGADDVDGAGVAYVYETGPDGITVLAATLRAPDPEAGDLFGHAVAIDGGTIAVGAPGEIPQSTFTGSGRQRAYVFRRSAAGRWRLAATLRRSAAPATGAVFGWGVAVSRGTVAVSAIDPLGAGAVGEADVFVRPATGWRDMTQTARLVPAGVVPDDQAGSAIGLDGPTLVLGAERVADGGAMVGAAYVFTRPAAGWTDATGGVRLPLASGRDMDGFGTAVAVHGRVIAVGAPGGAWWGNRPYAAVYRRPAGGWGALAEPTALVEAPDDDLMFGISVALAPGVLVVGARAKAATTDRGRAYVYGVAGDGAIDADPAIIRAPRAVADAGAFGVVAASGSRIAVGAPNVSVAGRGGSAYLDAVAAIHVLRSSMDADGTLHLRVRVPGAGVLAARGTAGWRVGGRVVYCRDAARAARAGVVALTCRPNAAERAALARGQVRLLIRYAFRSAPQAPLEALERYALRASTPVTG